MNDWFQRFRFCGDLDCPDWVLAEISILSKLVITEICYLLQLTEYCTV